MRCIYLYQKLFGQAIHLMQKNITDHAWVFVRNRKLLWRHDFHSNHIVKYTTIDGRIDLSMFIADVNTSIWLWLLQTGTHWFHYPYCKYKHIDLRIYLLQYLNVNTWVWVLLNIYCNCEKNDRFVRNSRKEKNIDFEIKIVLKRFTRLLSYWLKIR